MFIVENSGKRLLIINTKLHDPIPSPRSNYMLLTFWYLPCLSLFAIEYHRLSGLNKEFP